MEATPIIDRGGLLFSEWNSTFLGSDVFLERTAIVGVRQTVGECPIGAKPSHSALGG